MIYVVTFDVKQTGRTNHFVYHCNAGTAKEACRIAREQWPLVLRFEKVPKQIRMHAVRSRLKDPALLRVISWRGDVFNGRSCFDFLCCDVTKER